mgnify:CR=1 FL=1
MNIDREQIENRKIILQNDINTARERIAENDKNRQEDVALINALTGASQQCDAFLQELDDASSDDGNDKE